MLTDSDRVDVQILPEQVTRAPPPPAVAAESAVGAASEHDLRNIAVTGVPQPAHPANGGAAAPLLLDEVIKRTLVRSLEETEGNRRRAADLLGISRSTLYRMLARYGLADDGPRHRIGGESTTIGIRPPGS
jgi:transcriptional regulator of acetoin/glycerol metabolism